MNKDPQRGFAAFVLLFVVLLVGVGAGAYYYGKGSLKLPVVAPQVSPSSEISTPSSTTDETVNWKVYMDQRYGFSFKYPSDWDTTNLGTSLVVAPQSVVDGIKKIAGGFGGGKGLVSSLYVNKQRVPTKSDGFQKVSSTQIVVGGKNATLHTITVTQASPLGESGERVIQVEIPFEKGFVEYELLDTRYRSIYDQILSTFKFAN
ncbi:MAG: hypothetical protein HYU80_01105 [Candidatus Blackburnbacteria bacterium]|nr:hypothetical protein [Candidatus Blackburnbacteria bacterium]